MIHRTYTERPLFQLNSPDSVTFATYGDMGTAMPLGFAVFERLKTEHERRPLDFVFHQVVPITLITFSYLLKLMHQWPRRATSRTLGWTLRCPISISLKTTSWSTYGIYSCARSNRWLPPRPTWWATATTRPGWLWVGECGAGGACVSRLVCFYNRHQNRLGGGSVCCNSTLLVAGDSYPHLDTSPSPTFHTHTRARTHTQGTIGRPSPLDLPCPLHPGVTAAVTVISGSHSTMAPCT